MMIQRTFKRWELGREAAILFKGSQEYINCNINDLSTTGFSVALPLKLPVNTFLDFELQLSDELSLRAQAWVVWHKPEGELYNYGLYVTELDPRDEEKIRKFIQLYSQFHHKSHGGESKTIVLKKGEAQVNDRRIFQRFESGFSVSFLDVADGSEGSGRIQDISAKGVGLMSERQLRPRSSLELWLRIPDRGEPLYTRGEVVWAKRLADGRYQGGINLERADLMGLSRILRMRE